MTNEEAVEILEGAIKKPNTKDGYLGQALDMAIKALEQQPCEDAISRNELLSRIDAERKHLLDIKMDGAEHVIVHHARRIIEDMPSITPKALEQQPCEDCISILNRIMEYTYGMLTTEKFGLQHLIKSMMDDLPSVQPQQKIGHWIDIMVADMKKAESEE